MIQHHSMHPLMVDAAFIVVSLNKTSLFPQHNFALKQVYDKQGQLLQYADLQG
jgi:hypothetical protein